jgi:hypothetical protein
MLFTGLLLQIAGRRRDNILNLTKSDDNTNIQQFITTME